MALSRQQKLIIITLVFYWPTLFILSHIPMPQLVHQADVSDKGLHFLAYLILTFLLWSAINPNKKVNWRPRVFPLFLLSKESRGGAGAWWILLVVILYSICDELLQGYVRGRSCDATDFVANLAGTLTGLIMLSVFTFWPACLVVTVITIFGLTNIARVNIADLLPVTNTAFHFFAYAFFTLLWIQYIQRLTKLVAPKPKWLIVASIVPMSLLMAVKLGSLILGRSCTITDVLVSAIGIAIVVGTTYLIVFFRQPHSKVERLSPPDS